MQWIAREREKRLRVCLMELCVFFFYLFSASVHQQSPIIDRVAASTPPTLSNLSSDSAYDKFRLLNGHHVSVLLLLRRCLFIVRLNKLKCH